MTRHALLRRATIVIGTLTVLGLSGWSQAQPASAMSCFTVAGKVTCIDTTFAPTAPLMPPVIVPIGANGDGEDLHIVIRDDGGRQVARG